MTAFWNIAQLTEMHLMKNCCNEQNQIITYMMRKTVKKLLQYFLHVLQNVAQTTAQIIMSNSEQDWILLWMLYKFPNQQNITNSWFNKKKLKKKKIVEYHLGIGCYTCYVHPHTSLGCWRSWQVLVVHHCLGALNAKLCRQVRSSI